MASFSGNSSGTLTTTTTTTTSVQRVSSEEDLQQVMNERKRKRMESNRESAKRSRMRKQKHLDDLTAQVACLRRDNGQILTAVQLTTQRLLSVDAENSVLRAQFDELTTRLDSLTEILKFMDSYSGGGGGSGGAGGAAAAAVDMVVGFDGLMGNHWCVNQPIMASADYQVFGY